MFRFKRFVVGISMLVCATAYATDVQVTVGEMTDTRSTGNTFSQMTLRLMLLGDDAMKIRGVKAEVKTAIDETGRDLVMGPDDGIGMPKEGMESVDRNGIGNVNTSVNLKNPARKASVIKELTGDLQVYMPENDPQSTVYIKECTKDMGKPLSSPPLEKEGVSVTVFSKETYEAFKREEERKAKEASEQDAGNALAEGLKGAFQNMFGMSSEMGPNDIVIKTDDPDQKLVSVEMVDAAGAKIKSKGSSRSREKSGKIETLRYDTPVPADAQLKILIKTPDSLVTVPFKLVDIPLP